MFLLVWGLTRVLPATQTSRGMETVDGDLSQSRRSIWDPLAGYPTPKMRHMEEAPSLVLYNAANQEIGHPTSINTFYENTLSAQATN